MLIRSLIFGIISLGGVACTASLEDVSSETRRPENLMGVKIEADCPISKPVSNLLANGSLNHSVWENVFKDLRGDDLVEEFLTDWKRGDNYTVLRAQCFDSPAARKSFYVDVMTPRLGTVRLMAVLEESGVVAYTFLIFPVYSLRLTE